MNQKRVLRLANQIQYFRQKSLIALIIKACLLRWLILKTNFKIWRKTVYGHTTCYLVFPYQYKKLIPDFTSYYQMKGFSFPSTNYSSIFGIELKISWEDTETDIGRTYEL